MPYPTPSFRHLKNLNKKERDRTPPEFAEYLVGRMYKLFGETVLAALWCCEDTWYRNIPGVEVWDNGKSATGLTMDAGRYPGPWPIIAHPPCGPWGKLRAFSYEDYEHGIQAMEYVHQYGGVVEQPHGSQLFKQYGKKSVSVEVLWQGDYGHRAPKKTLLYWYKPPAIYGWVPSGKLRRRRQRSTI